MVVKKLKKLVSQLVASDSGAAAKAEAKAKLSAEEKIGSKKSVSSSSAVKLSDQTDEPEISASSVKTVKVAAESKTPSETKPNVESKTNSESKNVKDTTMNDTTAAPTESKSVVHSYLEVAGELLSKPTTLCDLLESRGAPKTLVFCNSPSDTDFVDVMIRKRGLSSAKLIGFVSPEKTASITQKLSNGDLISVVATDIAARGLDFSQFELIINYSLPQDSGSYEERSGGSVYGGEIISIVSPLDLTAFMQLKKALNVPFTQIDLPDAKDLSKAKVSRIVRSAQLKASEISENAKRIAQEVLKGDYAELVVGYLVAQSLEIVPQLQSQIEKLTLERQLEEDGGQPGARPSGRFGGRDDNRRPDDRGGDRNQGRFADRRGRDDDEQRGNSDRGSERSGNNDRGNTERGGNDRGANDRGTNDRGGSDRGANDRGQGRSQNRRRFDDQDGGQDNSRREESSAPRKQVIRQKDERLYLGQGSEHGFTAEKLTGMVAGKDLAADAIRRVSVRSTYSFIDVGEGVAEILIPALTEVEGSNGKKLYCVKAATIVTSETTDAPTENSESSPIAEGNLDEGTPQPAEIV